MLQNWQKTGCAGVFFDKVRLANLIKKTPAKAFSCEFFEIIKDTFFKKHLRATASSTGKIPMIAGRKYHFLALYGFSFWLIAFSWTLPWNAGTLFKLFTKGRRKVFQEIYLCYQSMIYVCYVCHCWKGFKSLITICYLHDFFFYVLFVSFWPRIK